MLGVDTSPRWAEGAESQNRLSAPMLRRPGPGNNTGSFLSWGAAFLHSMPSRPPALTISRPSMEEAERPTSFTPMRSRCNLGKHLGCILTPPVGGIRSRPSTYTTSLHLEVEITPTLPPFIPMPRPSITGTDSICGSAAIFQRIGTMKYGSPTTERYWWQLEEEAEPRTPSTPTRHPMTIGEDSNSSGKMTATMPFEPSTGTTLPP